MRLALIGYGNVGRAFARLIKSQPYPLEIAGIHTLRHGTDYGSGFGPAAGSIDEFLDRCQSDAVVELTTLNPHTGEPAISHIRAAFARKRHVVTANKGPIAHAWADLQNEANRAGVQFRFESTVMDGAPVFNMVRKTLPGVRVLGFSGVLNSTSKVVIAAMRNGQTREQGIDEARRLGITESDPSYDLDGWDSAAKTAALANVFLDARTNPTRIERAGIGEFSAEQILDLGRQRKTVALVSRAGQERLTVKPEIMDENDILTAVKGTSNLLLLHTDLMGTVGTVVINPGVEQTAYGVFSDLVDIL
jgi:homoserine dehydrogenase